MSTKESLLEAIHSFFGSDCAILMGDDDFVRLLKELKEDAASFSGPTMSTQFFQKNDIAIFGATVMTNATPGTTGWIIGPKESIERMREAIWMTNYIRLFKDTPDGIKYAYVPMP